MERDSIVTDIHRPDPWTQLKAFTSARIALGRSGASLPTAEVLRFGVAHAQARDAVHLPFDVAAVRDALIAHGFDSLEVESAAADRTTYLKRPDLGRRLSMRSREWLVARATTPCDVLCVIGDGLSSQAVHAQAVPLLLELRPRLESAGLQTGPIVLARQARVALGDEIGELLAARVVVMLIGERPGLSSPDSLGAYLTWAPRVGCVDAERNCVSNIRPEGLSHGEAAHKIAWLVGAARQLGATGVRLKDESHTLALSFNVRDALARDDDAVRALHVEAFASHPSSDHTEHLIVDRLRARGRLTLSLVACDTSGAVVGHAAFSPVLIAGADRGWFGLGPLAVLPAQQARGIGSALVRHGLERLAQAGARGCVVLGDPAYYGRFGFASSPQLQFPGPPATHFMALALGAHAIPSGVVRYDPAFDAAP